MFELPQNIVCCNASGGHPPTEEFPVPDDDDVSSLGGSNENNVKDEQRAMSVVKCEQLVISSDNLDENEFQEKTLLFSTIENKNWEQVLTLLETGRVGGHFFCGLSGEGSDVEKLDLRTQVRTWVMTKDWWGNIASRSLPIHSAIKQKAPIRIIQKLADIYPEGTRCQDQDGNLPLHLAFKHEAPDDVIALLLKMFPEAVGVKNKAGRQPVDFATPEAGEIIQLCVEQTKRAAELEEIRLSQALESEKTRLTEILLQLSEIRGELDLLRKTKKKNADAFTQHEKMEAELLDQDFAPGVVKGMLPEDTDKKKRIGNAKIKLPWSRK